MAFFAFLVLGVYALWKQARTVAIALVVYPVLHLLYMSSQWLLSTRNLLAICPFAAVLAARGIMYAHQSIRLPYARTALAGFVGLALGINALWLNKAADSIARRGTAHYAEEFAAHLDKYSMSTFFVSPSIANMLSQLGGPPRPNVTQQIENADYVCAFHREVVKDFAWTPSTDPFLTVKWFGPACVNINYYPTWGGDHMIMVLTREKFEHLPALVEKHRRINDERKAKAPRHRPPA
jgi:hypothetical protein